MPRTPVFIKYRLQWRAIWLCLLFILPFSVPGADRSVRVAWDPNPEANIKGYRIYHGAVTAGSTNMMDVGLNTVGSVTNLSYNTRYFFYVTAYNEYDLESDPSAVLYYTTAAQTPVTVTTDDTLLAFAPVELRIPAHLAGDVGSGLEIRWDQLTGPTTVTIQGGNSIQPVVQLATPGNYAFQVAVSDDSSSDQAQVKIKVVEAAAASGDSSLQLYPLQFLFDGIAVYWDSTEGAIYDIGFRRDLNSPYWILLETNIQSHGDVYTFWVDDSPDLLQTGFYNVFRTN